MTIEYLDLADYLAIAAEITGSMSGHWTRVTRLSLADSSLHAPSAGFGEVELYPDFVDKAAVLLVRLTNNHPLLDGNKRAAWVEMRLFVALNGWEWRTRPSIDDAEATVIAIAAGELDEAGTARWLSKYLTPRR